MYICSDRHLRVLTDGKRQLISIVEIIEVCEGMDDFINTVGHYIGIIWDHFLIGLGTVFLTPIVK